MEAGAEIRGFDVRRKGDKPAAIESVLEFIAKAKRDSSFEFDVRLILEELLNNALYHAFQDVAGNEKYRIQDFEAIADDEEVRLTVGMDSRTIGISVADNQGRLTRDTTLGKLERHLTIQGLLDENGRGLYLTYSLAGRLIVNLQPGESSELVALFPHSPDSWPELSPSRPILIFEHRSPSPRT